MVAFMRSMVVLSMVVTHMASIPTMAVSPSCSFQASHEKESSKDSNGANKSAHPVTGELVPGQHLIEGDIEESASRQALQNPNCQHMSSSSLLHMNGHNDANEDPNGGDDAQD